MRGEPTIRSIMLADSAYQCPSTGKISLLGIFAHMKVPTTEIGPIVNGLKVSQDFVVYRVVADALKGMRHALRIHDDPNWSLQIYNEHFPDDIPIGKSVELITSVQNLEIPRPGMYYVEVTVGPETVSTPVLIEAQR